MTYTPMVTVPVTVPLPIMEGKVRVETDDVIYLVETVFRHVEDNFVFTMFNGAFREEQAAERHAKELRSMSLKLGIGECVWDCIRVSPYTLR